MRRDSWLGWLAAFLAAVTISALAVSGWAIRRSDNRLENALFALCAFQDDLQRRVLLGQEFLERHPDGIPGLARSDLERSLSNQQQTLAALAPYLTSCPKEEDVL